MNIVFLANNCSECGIVPENSLKWLITVVLAIYFLGQ